MANIDFSMMFEPALKFLHELGQKIRKTKGTADCWHKGKMYKPGENFKVGGCALCTCGGKSSYAVLLP